MFNNAFLNNNVDLVNLNLEIMGDPYWMVDSGLTNYFSPPSGETEQKNEDGTANYEGIDVYIYITFRTPADVNTSTSLYNFSKEEVISPFSGIYKVISCVNIFEDGLFKQTLKCIRMRGQSIDFDESLDTEKESVGVFDQEIANDPTSEHIAPDAKSFNIEINTFLDDVASTTIVSQPNERPNQPPPSSPPDGTGENVQTETGEQEEQPTDSETVSEEDAPDFEETPLADEETRLSDNEAGVVEPKLVEPEKTIADANTKQAALQRIKDEGQSEESIKAAIEVGALQEGRIDPQTGEITGDVALTQGRLELSGEVRDDLYNNFDFTPTPQRAATLQSGIESTNARIERGQSQIDAAIARGEDPARIAQAQQKVDRLRESNQTRQAELNQVQQAIAQKEDILNKVQQ